MSRIKHFLVKLSFNKKVTSNSFLVWLLNQIFMILFTKKEDWLFVNIPSLYKFFPEFMLYLHVVNTEPAYV